MKSDLIGKKFPVLDNGHVILLDYMGSDHSIAQAARTSYGKGTKSVSDDTALIRYLLRHHHSSPVEQAELQFHVRVPMDIWRQWIRHRTACLAGDTELHFDSPRRQKKGKSGLYKMTVKQVFDKFQPTENTQRPDKQGNAYHKRDRVQSMNLRCVDEETGEVRHTRIVDIWESGVKQLYKLTTKDGQTVRASRDHLFFTGNEWKKLKELCPGDSVIILTSRKGTPPASFNKVDPETEEWVPIIGWEGWYEISDQGRVRRIVGGKGARSHGRCKKITVDCGRAVTSLNRPGKQESILVYREMLRAFVGEPEPEQQACHENGNALDNRLENLYWGTPKENGEDMVRHGRSTYLVSSPSRIISIEPDGEEMTYDIEVDGPWHNFSANGIIVHNSVNEYSTRYSEAIDEMAVTGPGEWRIQSTNNKQGSEGFLDKEDGSLLTARERDFHDAARQLYQFRLKKGVAREQARKDLPLSTYTEAIWKMDLSNLLHFLGLRMDGHAQKEIKNYADVIGYEIVSKLFPITFQAFVDYRLKAMTVTNLDQQAINRINSGCDAEKTLLEIFSNKREREECRRKMKHLGML